MVKQGLVGSTNICTRVRRLLPVALNSYLICQIELKRNLFQSQIYGSNISFLGSEGKAIITTATYLPFFGNTYLGIDLSLSSFIFSLMNEKYGSHPVFIAYIYILSIELMGKRADPALADPLRESSLDRDVARSVCPRLWPTHRSLC